MKSHSITAIAVVVGLLVATAPEWAVARSADSSGSADFKKPVGLDSASGLGGKSPEVSVNLTSGTVGDALVSIAKQAGWGLVMSAPQDLLDRPMTLIIEKKPAGEVLDTIAKSGNLDVSLRNGVLHVTGVTPPAPAAEDASTASESEAEESPPKDVHRPWDRFREHMAAHWKRDKGDLKQRKLKSRVEIGDSVTVDADEHVSEAVSVGGSTTVHGHVEKDAVAVGGHTTIKAGAVVEGSAVAVGGDLVVEEGAVVEDDAVSVGGKVKVAEGALVEGDQVSVGIPLPAVGGLAGAFGGMMVMNVLCALMRSIFLYAIALLLVWLVPRRLDSLKSYMTAKPGASILSGFLLFLAMLPLIILLAITIIGIPLIPVAVVAWIALIIMGFAAFYVWLGERIPIFKDKKSAFVALTIGFIVFMVITIIPVIGGIFSLIVAFAASGAALQTRFGKRDPF